MLPCPVCGSPLGLSLDFILKHPISACPGCKTVFNFDVEDEVKGKMNAALNDIEKIKKRYQGLVTFN